MIYPQKGSWRLSSIRSLWLGLAFSIALATLLVFLSAISVAVGQGNEETVIVRLAKADYARIAPIETVHLIEYRSFVWLELTQEGFSELVESGVDFERPPAPTVLDFRGHRFDTRFEGPSVPGDQRASFAPGVPSFHVLQLRGPVKNEWHRQLKANGVELIQSHPPHAYVVRMTPEQAATVEAFDFVRWVGPYHPAFKITSILQRVMRQPVPSGVRVTDGKIENVIIMFYNGSETGPTLASTVEGVEALGGELIDVIPTMGIDISLAGATFRLPVSAIVRTARLNDVFLLGYSYPEPVLEDEVSDQIVAGTYDPVTPGYQEWLSALGLSGAGVTVGLIDTGYDTGIAATVHPDVRGRFIPSGVPTDTNGHGTHVGGIIAGNASLGYTDTHGFLFGLGVAPEVSMVVTSSFGHLQLTDTVPAMAGLGAVAVNNSYGLHRTDEGYDEHDRLVDQLVRDAIPSSGLRNDPLSLVFSVGNCGRGTLRLPFCMSNEISPTKQAKNIIAVGATLNQRQNDGIYTSTIDIDEVADFSSRGPTADGRIYPHVVAPGDNVISTRSSVPIPPPPQPSGCRDIPLAAGAPAITPTYSICSGTSMAAPHVTGAIALLTEWWRSFHAGLDPSPAMVKALLVNNAEDIAGNTGPIPNNDEGWGRINIANVVSASVPSIYIDQTVVFTDTDDRWVGTFIAADRSQPLRVTLVWTDPPGPIGHNPTLINDLDLSVETENLVYLGNNFSGGWTEQGGSSPDRLDNLENVYIETPPAGMFDIQVRAIDIRGDGVPNNGQALDQNFALVIQNAIPVNVDVALIIDSSGSMSWNDPDNRRLAASHTYLDASADGDYVGVVDFDGTARIASPALRLPENHATLAAAIDTIDSSGSTNIGLGVAAGYNVLTASPSENVVKAAILLTDGEGNYNDQHEQFAEQGWSIYAFGFGSANDALLTEIATSTGGEYRRLPTSNLPCEFQAVRARIAGAEPQPCQTVHVLPGQTVTFTQNVPPGQGQATFSTSWPGSDVVMTLTSPSGRLIDRNTVAPDVTHNLGATFETYRITNPQGGDWEVSLYGADLPAGGEEVVFGFTTLPPSQPTRTVNSTGDGADANPGDGVCDDGAGNCTLRAAIQEANATAGSDTIAFNIPGNSPHTIQPGSPLPAITESVVIDGGTEPDYAGSPVVELDGSLAGVLADGLKIQAANVTVRALAINRFDGAGINVASGASGAVLEGNYVGTDTGGSLALGNLGAGIYVNNAGGATVGGTSAGARNVISGNGGAGILVSGAGATSSTIQGNYIGTNAAGAADVGNGLDGIYVRNSAANHTIGGVSAGAGNLISGNDQDGIELDSVSGNVLQGNRIGTNAGGTAALGNTEQGIRIENAANNTVGGTAAGAGNLVSGNGRDGVALKGLNATGNQVLGNFVGTDVTGNSALGNAAAGIYLYSNAGSNTVGGATAEARNLVSGNAGRGITIADAETTGNIVQGNYVGTDIGGSLDLGNGSDGIYVYSSAASNTIGGSTSGAGNVISGNAGSGVYIRNSLATVVHGNLIGVAADGTTALGNARSGVYFYSTSVGNQIGGPGAGEGNTIANNGREGVGVNNNSNDNAIRGNRIYANANLGIDLGFNGVDTNDAGDVDTGPNNRQNYPLLASASSDSNSTTIAGSLNSAASTQFTLDFYASDSCDPSGYGEGERYLGSDTVTTDGNGDVGFNSVLATSTAGVAQVTATATDPDGNTSEFSACVQASYTP